MTDTTIMLHGPFTATKRQHTSEDFPVHTWLNIETPSVSLVLHSLPNPRTISAAINPSASCHPLLTMLEHALEQLAIGDYTSAQEAIMNLREVAASTCDYLCDLATPDDQSA